MSKRDKLIEKILKGKSNISPNEAVKMSRNPSLRTQCGNLGFLLLLPPLKCVSFWVTLRRPAGGSSHITFRKANAQSVTIVLTQNPLKPYMVSKLQTALKIEGYHYD